MANLIYANARAKAMEKNLLSLERFNRMIECSTADEAIKILSEVGFGDGAVIESALEFEKLIATEQRKLLDFLKEASSNKNFASFILLKNDYHNAEVYIKAKHLRVDFDDMTVEAGLINKEVLKEKILTDDYRDFSAEMRDALIFCDNEFVSNRTSGQTINSALTKAYYLELFNLSKKDKRLKKIFEFKIDTINIGIALRARNYSEFSKMALQYGTLTEKDYKNLCEMPLENLKEQFRYSEYKLAVNLAVDQKIKGQPLSDFEKLADNFALKMLKQEKYQTEGIIPLMIYVFAKLNEISNVRIVLVGLINGIEKAQIKRKLREIYEG